MTVRKTLRRALVISYVILRYLMTDQWLGARSRYWRCVCWLNPFQYRRGRYTRGQALRLALETLGPIFVKFGQLLSTRSDLLPSDVIAELEKCQDQVPAFSGEEAVRIVESTWGESVDSLFLSFDIEPLASASVAQVHAARLQDGTDVVVKILRPKIKKTIQEDIALMYHLAAWIRWRWPGSHRLRLDELVGEFEHTILNELDLVREAANAAQLRRNFSGSTMMMVPQVYWQFIKSNIMVSERVFGVRISDVKTLHERDVNMKRLAEHGVIIFFTQVFKDRFFHADMHPGNLFVDTRDPENPVYQGVDFGIMGTLTMEDQRYLGENMLAFFERDYYRIAQLHVESGWVPRDTNVEQFEAAIRAVCEPIFSKPLSEISFGNLLLRLLQTAKDFKMEVQPQLMLLQKTLLGVESLGRRLYPTLDLWSTAMPFLSDWLKEQKSPKVVLKQIKSQWQPFLEKTLRTPSMMYDALKHVEQLSKQGVSASKGHVNAEKKYGRIHRLAGMMAIGGGVYALASASVSVLAVMPWFMIVAGVFLIY